MRVVARPSSLPHLESLELERVENLGRITDVLFPEDGKACLRSFSSDEDSAEPAWVTIMARAGRHLEELTLIEWEKGMCSR